MGARWTARIAGFATVLLGLVALLGWLNVFNPVGRMYADRFELVNETDEPIEVTPIGYSFHERRRVPLPQYATGRLNLPVLRPAHVVGPHATIDLSFDADDHGLSDLVLEGRSGGPRWLPLASYPTGSPLEQPDTSRWVIKSLSALRPAPDEVLEVRGQATRRGLWGLVLYVGFLPAGLLWKASRRPNLKAAAGTQPA
jgi:hypothetical protein